jgi:hypothetical protein
MKNKEQSKIEKRNYLFFWECDVKFILTILLLNNKNKISNLYGIKIKY